MRKPVNPVPPPEQPSTAIVLVGTYELEAPLTSSPYVLFTASLPANYRIEEAGCFRATGQQPSNRPFGTKEKLIIRVRQLGEGAVVARFLAVWNIEGRMSLPHIRPHARDPQDSAMLQWSFWQGVRIGGGLYHDVFDVTHFDLELP